MNILKSCISIEPTFYCATVCRYAICLSLVFLVLLGETIHGTVVLKKTQESTPLS